MSGFMRLRQVSPVVSVKGVPGTGRVAVPDAHTLVWLCGRLECVSTAGLQRRYGAKDITAWVPQNKGTC